VCRPPPRATVGRALRRIDLVAPALLCCPPAPGFAVRLPVDRMWGEPNFFIFALDRISIPQNVLDRIAPIAMPRSSLIISDEPLNSKLVRGVNRLPCSSNYWMPSKRVVGPGNPGDVLRPPQRPCARPPRTISRRLGPREETARGGSNHYREVQHARVCARDNHRWLVVWRNMSSHRRYADWTISRIATPRSLAQQPRRSAISSWSSAAPQTLSCHLAAVWIMGGSLALTLLRLPRAIHCSSLFSSCWGSCRASCRPSCRRGALRARARARARLRGSRRC